MAPPLELLVVDADGRTSAALERLSRELGCSVRTTSSVAEARAALARPASEGVDACLVDACLPEARGLLAELANRGDGPEAVALVDAAAAVEGNTPAVLERLGLPVERAGLEACLLRIRRTRGLRSALSREQRERAAEAGEILLGESPARVRLVEEIERVAGTPRTTVLVRGPRGAGKELVARAIHARSARAEGPFLAVSCAAGGSGPGLGRDLFDGAGGGNLLRAAQGGTLFLAQAGSLPPELQAALLAFLEERSYGGRDHAEADVRMVAASNPDLEELVHREVFREDLLYRLNVLAVRVPPLVERRDDVPALARAALRRSAAGLGRSIAGFSPEATERLVAHDWPGNVRELRLVVERAALLSPGDVVAADALPLGGGRRTASGDALIPADRTLRGMEEALIRRTLAEEAGNRSRTARVLGIDRTTLYHKLRRYGIG